MTHCALVILAALAVPEVSFVDQAEPGNVFFAGEPVEIRAAVATGTTVEWTVKDFEGNRVASGTSPAAEHRAAVRPGALGIGFYVVEIVSKDGPAEKGRAETSMAVLTPVDVATLADSKFGVTTHFAQGMSPDVMGILARAGIAHIRDEQAWSHVEKEKGKFEFPKPLEAYMSALNEKHISPLIVLAFGNTLYGQPRNVPVWALAPWNAEGYEAYARYSEAVLAHYGKQVREVEVWNEYNGSFCQGPASADRPKHYAEMLEAAHAKIKAARPDVTVVGGAAVLVPLPYFDKLFALGALGNMDAIAVHPYRETPEGVEREIAALTELVKKHNAGASKPIWVTETSCMADATPERVGSAEYLARMFVLLQTRQEVERIYWYLAHDFREFKHLGLLHGEKDPWGRFTPTAAYVAYANIARLFHGATFEARESTDPRTRVYRFSREDARIWAFWSTAGESGLTFTNPMPLTVVDLVGRERALVPVAGKVVLPVTSRPAFVVVRGAAPMTVSETPRNDAVVADSVEDFSGTQGQRGWSYGWFVADAAYSPDQVKPMTWGASQGDWDYRWRGSAGEHLSICERSTHPGIEGRHPAWSVRRWTSDADRTVRLKGEFVRGAQGDGVGCKIFIDGAEAWSQMVPPDGKGEFDIPATLKKGSRVDFVLTPGPGTDTSFDATRFEAMVLTETR